MIQGFGQIYGRTSMTQGRNAMSDYKFVIPTTDSGTQNKLNQFKAGFKANFAALGYVAGDSTAVDNAANNFSAALTASDAAKAAAANAVDYKDKTKQSSSSTIRTWAQRVKTNPAATPAILASMGITPASAPAGPVTVPTDLSATPSASGTCTLRWSANGNVSTTNYVLESNTNGAGWVWLGSTTKKSFTDGGAIPGVPKLYRIRAQRAGSTSAPSAQASIYGGEEELTLKIAA